MAYKVGLDVQEGVARGFTSLVEPSKRNIGILMARERGLVNQALLLSSLEEDRKNFGGYLAGAYGYAVMKNLFRNTKGYSPTVYGVRVVGADSAAATGTLSTGTVSIDFYAAMNNQEDVGSWGNNLTINLYPKGSKINGKWYLEVLLSGVVVENYTSATMSALLTSIFENSNYIGSALDVAGLDTEAELVTNVALNGTLSVGISGGQADNKTFALSVTTASFDTAYEGSILVDSFGNKIGIVATYDDTTRVGTLEDVALVNGVLSNTTYLPDSAFTVTLSGGVYNAPVESDFYGRTTDLGKFGLDIFNEQDVQIVCNSEFHTKTMAVEGKAYAETNDKLYVFVTPEVTDFSVAQDFASVLQSDSRSFVAGYKVWVRTLINDTDYGYVPGIGCILGAGYVGATGMQGDFIHIPPAGVDSAFSDIIEVKDGKLSQQEIDRYVQDFTLNVVKFQKGLGYFLISSRTMSTNALYHSVHIRLQTAFYKSVLRNNFNWVLQKPNTPELKKEIFASVFSYFKIEYGNGALENSIPFDKACVIIIDQRNNPVGQDRKLLNLDIDWIPTEAVEAFRISLNRNDGQLLIDEANLD